MNGAVDPESAASPRTGGYRLGAVNALWPDVRATTAIGGGTASYWADAEAIGASGVIAADGSTNVLGNFGFRCEASGDPTWVGGVQFEVVGASSWTIGGFALNNPSDSTTQKQMDHTDWLTLRDVTTLDRSLAATYVLIVDPEAISAATARTQALALIDKVTACDRMIGLPAPNVLFIVWPKTSARSVAEMSAWRDGIISACADRPNAGYINLFDYYGQAVPAHIDSDGTHPDDEAAADALAADIWTLLLSASARDRHTLYELASAVWDRPAADLAIADSVGELVATNLDATVSSRSDFDASTDLVSANVTQVSGDSGAADNLEAILDGTGGRAEFAAGADYPGILIRSSTPEAAMQIVHSEELSTALLIQAEGSGSDSITLSDGSGKGIDGTGLTAVGDAAATAILATPANKLATDASGYVELPAVDGVAASKWRELLLATATGKTSLTDNGDGTKTLRFYKQDATTPLLDVTFNTTGEHTATDIDP